MNTKVKRLLNALSLELKDLNIEKQKRIQEIIQDKGKGYNYKWIDNVMNYRHITKGKDKFGYEEAWHGLTGE